LMLNRMEEGTGRFASRYTALMPPGLQQRYRAELNRNGSCQVGGEEAELLDIYCVQGDTLNVHAVQTPKVLVLGGEQISIGKERCLNLAGIYVAIDEDGCPYLCGPGGQRYL